MSILGRSPCAESGIILGGGGGGPGPTAGKQSGQLFFFIVLPYFTVNRGGPMVLLQRKLYFSKDPEGFQNFPGGGGQTSSLCYFLKKPI